MFGIDLDLFVIYSFGFTNVKKIKISSFEVSVDIIEFFARNLIKLQFLDIYEVNFGQILPFIRHSKTLMTIKIQELNIEFFDWFALNEERKKLENAAQVTIYIPEEIYLDEIWKSKNLNLEYFKLVRYVDDI